MFLSLEQERNIIVFFFVVDFFHFCQRSACINVAMCGGDCISPSFDANSIWKFFLNMSDVQKTANCCLLDITHNSEKNLIRYYPLT